MGVLPLQFANGESADSPSDSQGRESIDLTGLCGTSTAELVGRELTVAADDRVFRWCWRRTPGEAGYLWHGGILPFVVRALARV